MQPEFWRERWELGQTGFHKDEVHPDIEAQHEWLLGEGEHRVLVPLCGKTLDLDWIARRGDTAVGVELSEIAVHALFEQAGRTPEITVRGTKKIFRTEGLIVICGDFFDVNVEDVAPIDRVWDRAAMVALPPQMRRRYVEHLRSLVQPGARVLLNTLVYDDCAKEGPPHSVDDFEVANAYEGAQIELFDRRDLTDEIRPHWLEAGMTRLHSHLHRITLPGAG